MKNNSSEKNPTQNTVPQFLVEKLLIKMGMEQGAARAAVGAVPVAGQVYLLLSFVDALEQTKQYINNNDLSKMAADITSAQYLEYYSTMRKANDEMKAGVLSIDEVGALNDQFNGPQSAEKSLVYQAYKEVQANQNQ